MRTTTLKPLIPRQHENTGSQSMLAATSIRLHLLPDAPDAEGEPRAALLVPASSPALGRRPALLLFANIAAAIAAKREMEARS